MPPAFALPRFRYHPDPLETGSVRASDARCISCGEARGYAYAGPVYAEEDLPGSICPWCVADGSAARKFGATFIPEDAIGGFGDWEAVPALVLDEVAHRTPGFSGWQPERWWTHCGDAAEFLGPAGRAELTSKWALAMRPLQESAQVADPDEWQDFLRMLSRHHAPTAFVFRCRRCRRFGGYIDST